MADPVALLGQCAHKCLKSLESAEGDALFKQLMDLIGKVKSSQKSPSWLKSENRPDQDLIINFTKWLDKENFDLSSHNVAIKNTQGSEGNGLFATGPIKRGDSVLKVPRNLMLSCSRALEIPLLAEMAQSDPVVGQNPSFLLALVVLVERLRGTESKWASYLDLLPLTYSIPLFFSYGELAMLKECEHTWVGAKKMVVNAAMQYAYVHRMLSGLEKSGKEGFVRLSDWTWEAMLWSLAVVLTRQNQIPVVGEQVEGMELALIPIWDMCNHVEGEITTFFDVKSDSLEFSAFQDLTEGDQVYIFYGRRTTQHLLMYSGFVPSTNTHNNIHIRLSLPESDSESLKASKQSLLGGVLGLGPSSGWWIPLDEEGKLDEKLGAPFLRICCLSEEELEREKGNTSFSSLVSLKNEVAGCELLVGTVAALLEKFSTKIEDDEKLAKAFGARGQNNGGELAVSYRISEKKLLQNAHAALLSRLQHLLKRLKQRNNKKKKKN